MSGLLSRYTGTLTLGNRGIHQKSTASPKWNGPWKSPHAISYPGWTPTTWQRITRASVFLILSARITAIFGEKHTDSLGNFPKYAFLYLSLVLFSEQHAIMMFSLMWQLFKHLKTTNMLPVFHYTYQSLWFSIWNLTIVACQKASEFNRHDS